VEKGGFMILRPDSGDPVEAVVMALEAAEKVFGVDVNSKGFKVPRACDVIQGDGINLDSIREILVAVLRKGFSAQVSL
jgi:nicotinic acid phosphoribosyltransferase